MYLPIQPMQIGLTSYIGFTVIQGPSIANNALRMLQHSGVLPEGASADRAGRFVRGQASAFGGLKELKPQQQKIFQDVHEWVCSGLEDVPASLSNAYASFREKPSIAGIAQYFDLLAGLIEEETRKRF